MKITHLFILVTSTVFAQNCTNADTAKNENLEATMADTANAVEEISETPISEPLKQEPEVYTWSNPQPWLNENQDKFQGEFESIESDSSKSRITIFSVNGELLGRLELNAEDTSCVVKNLTTLNVCHSSQLCLESEEENSSTVFTYGGDSLMMDVTYHSDIRIRYEKTKFGRTQLEVDSSATERTPEDLSNLKIALTGIHDDSTFPDEYEQLDWYAVGSNIDGTYIFPVALSVGRLERHSDMHGTYYHKSIKVHDMRAIDFLVSGIPSSWLLEKHIGGGFENKEMIYGDWNNLRFIDSDWRIIQTGSFEQYYSNTELMLTGTKNGKMLTQIINNEAYREFPADYKWTGDLDGDGFPDFIFNVSPKGYKDYRLYLSSKANENELVKEVHQLLASQYGC